MTIPPRFNPTVFQKHGFALKVLQTAFHFPSGGLIERCILSRLKMIKRSVCFFFFPLSLASSIKIYSRERKRCKLVGSFLRDRTNRRKALRKIDRCFDRAFSIKIYPRSKRGKKDKLKSENSLGVEIAFS